MAEGDPLGFDVFVGPSASGLVDMAGNGRSATGPELAENEMGARTTADTLPCIGAPGGVIDFGKDIFALVGQALTDDDLAQLGAQMGVIFNRSARLDPGATRVVASVTTAGASQSIVLDVTARTSTGIPINLRMSFAAGATAPTVERLAQGSGA